MARSLSSAIMMLIALCGCGVPIPPEEAGPYPADYKEIVKLLIYEAFDWSTMRDVSISTPRPMKIDWSKGWTVCLRGNVTNKYGAYVGLMDYSIFIWDGKSMFASKQISELCKDFDFSPWPEMEMPRGRRPVS